MVKFFFTTLILIVTMFLRNFSVLALPPEDDIPEEILATEIITQARSPFDNQPLTMAEYALLKEKIAKNPFPPQLNSKLRQKIFLLKILKMIRTILPINN
ncbi:hypothetical protein [Geminocystis sp. GBBB08]|uniref:hypothetical protein n=1 Tax=Geminocystis sp. GBBB08 TaxID=2604140 RepID=UPI0027E219C2|nr:hypothetical protein [Geminocystis sp. GBBB08]MBL1209734.1 hypothetical protein [Geminocystis sp. GBBB08]